MNSILLQAADATDEMSDCVEESAAAESCIETNSCSSLCGIGDEDAAGSDVDASAFDCTEFKNELQDATCTAAECCPACSNEITQFTQCSAEALKLLLSLFGEEGAASCDLTLTNCDSGSGSDPNGGGGSLASDISPDIMSNTLLAIAGCILFVIQ